MERIGTREAEYVLEVLKTQFQSSKSGNMTRRLETLFAQTFNSKYAIGVVNGTATLHAALAAAKIGPGDEVIITPLTMSSTAFAVLQANANPVFADICADTFTIDPNDIRRKITPRTKAVIPVSIYGLSPDMDPIMEIAKKHQLTVIEDNAQCFLGYYKGKIVGSIGHMASFSFQNSKHITCGEGGMIITDEDELADRVRSFCNLGYASVSRKSGKVTKDVLQDPGYERHTSFGFNYKLSELCSAVALAQVERMEELVKARLKAAKLYAQAIGECSWLTPQHIPDGLRHAYWSYVLKLETTQIDWHQFRKKYMQLGGDGIYSAWQLSYLEPVFQGHRFNPKGCPLGCAHVKGEVPQFKTGLCPVAESIQPRLLQFKTNYYDSSVAEQKAGALAETIKYFDP